MFPENQFEPQPSPPSRPSRGRGLAATLVGVALFSALVGVAADRWAITNLPQNPLGAVTIPTITTGPRIGPVAAPDGSRTAQRAPTATPTSDPTQQAIQQVIQNGDNEQSQALEQNNPAVMQDTSTSDFYQSQVSNNQDLRDNGVTDIKLVNIEWGPISINGSTASATAWETWTTTYSDGTTEQNRDRNEYTLVQQNGNWVISADDHPDDEVAGGTPGQGRGQGQGQGSGTGVPGRSVRPQDVSQNWSGYAATGGTYTAVNGTWTVPQFAPDSPAGADATWVGIGGVNTRDLIQAGTQQTVSGSGSTQYQAWVETLPRASHPVPLAVNPGDSISVSISQSDRGQDQWDVSYSNNTTGQTYHVTEQYTSSLSSAEWIEEAPSAARGRQLPLDNFGSVGFSQGSAVKNGQSVTIADSGAQPITMLARGNGTRQVARPSNLGADGASFTVTQG
jgi:Peptidase A4 family